MNLDQLPEVVSCDPEVHSGAPVFFGTRVPVKILFDHLKAGDCIDDFLEGFPTVTREQALALLDISQDLLAEQVEHAKFVG